MKNVILICVLGIFFLGVPEVFAQENNLLTGSGETEEVVLADVRITDVLFTEEDNALHGSFRLTNLLGTQSGITYGVIAQDSESVIVDVTSLGQGQGITLTEGESTHVDFAYNLPTHISGKVFFSLMAKTDNGLPLSVQPLLSRTFVDTGTTITCENNHDSRSIKCQSLADTTIDVSFFSGSEFSSPVKNEQLLVAAKVPVQIDLPKDPGFYTLHVRDKHSQSLVTMSVRVEGAFGKILNALAEVDGNGALAGVVAVYVSPFAGSMVGVSVKNNGNVCDTKEFTLEDMILKWSFIPKCSGDTVTVSLYDKEKTILAETNIPFTVVAMNVTDTEVQNIALDNTACCDTFPVDKILIVTLILVLMFVAYYLIKLLKKSKNPVIPMLFFMVMLGFGLSATTAEAVTLSRTALGPNGEISYSVFVTITPDKTDYVAGETMFINMSASVSTDAGATGVTLTDANVAYNKGAGVIKWNDPIMIGGPVVINPAPLALPNHTFWGPLVASSIGEVIPGTLPLGSNYVRIRMNYDTSFTAPRQEVGNMTINVVEPCAPAGSFYIWNGLNWDDFGVPSWAPGALTGYGMSNQGPVLGAATPLTGSVTGVTATAGSYPNKANHLQCGAVPQSVQLNFQ